MGWANCGIDDLDRPIGYVHEAICDFEGCEAIIDRGLGYACGGMHGHEDQYGKPACARYFCGEHQLNHACEFGHTDYGTEDQSEA